MFIPDLGQATAAPVPLNGAIDNPDVIIWAGDSSAVVLFNSSQSLLQFIKQIGGPPSVGASINLSSLQPGANDQSVLKASMPTSLPRLAASSPIRLLAADPLSGLAAVALTGRGRSQLYFIQEGVAPGFLMTLNVPAAAAFGTDDSLYVADSGTRQVWAIRNLSQAPLIQLLLSSTDGITQPAALALDNQYLYLADRSDMVLRVYSLLTLQKVDELALDTAPSSLARFSTSSFLVNAQRNPGEPVLIFQTSPARSVIFVPSGDNQ
jgi:hypothetical protein